MPLLSTEVQGTVCATMNPAEGVECFYRMLPCRVPCVPRKIRALTFTSRRPQISRIRTFRIPNAQVLQPSVLPQLAIKFGNSKKHHPNSYSRFKEFQKEKADCETSVTALDSGKSVKSAPKKNELHFKVG